MTEPHSSENQPSRSPSGPPRALPVVPPAEAFPLTHNQEYFWFLNELNPDSTAYLVPMAWRMRGPLNPVAIQHSLDCLMARHDSLRLRFGDIHGQAVQFLTPVDRWPLNHHDLSLEAEGTREEKLQKLLEEELGHPINLRAGPPLRGLLVKLHDEDHALLLLIHHIACDDKSCSVLAGEFSQFYRAICLGEPHGLGPVRQRFVDFARWHREQRAVDGFSREIDFWRKAIGAATGSEASQFGNEPNATAGSSGTRVPIHVPQSLVQRLLKIGGSEKATLFMTLLAGFHLLLQRCFQLRSTIVGIPSSGRLWENVESVVGNFVNTLPNHADFEQAKSFRSLLAQVRQHTIQALGHSDVPLGLLVEKLGHPQGPTRAPLINSLFVLRQFEPAFELHALKTERIQLPCLSAQFPISLWLVQRKDGLHGYLTHLLSAFDHKTAHSLAESYVTLLESCVERPDSPLSDLPLVSPADRKLLLDDWNRTFVPRTAGECLQDLIATQTGKNPGATAIRWGKFSLTYSELAQRAESIGLLLLSRGIRPGSHVGICMSRTPNLIAAMLGVLKAGAAYVPLDPAYPKERLEFMISDCQAQAVLCEGPFAAQLAGSSSEVIPIDKPFQLPESPPPWPTLPDTSAAYLMYTSGSTGRPKGVVLEHRNAVNFVRWAISVYSDAEVEGVLAGTTIGFDLSIVEIFVTLAKGGTILLAENVLHLADVAMSARITMVSTVPSAMEALLSRGQLPDSVRVVNLIGEPLPQSLVNRLFQNPGVEKVYDLYGPAETTTCSTFEPRQALGIANVGRAIHNTRLYVLDAGRQLLPPGITGELWIAGTGVARGYLNRPELTAERFVQDPFSNDVQARMYRTGDLVRYLSDGRLVYVGRNDSQVKIRGHRIELGEIESQLTSHPSVRQACVMVRNRGSVNPELIAFVGKLDASQPGVEELKGFLRTKLPEYMVPRSIHVLDSLPFNANGKVNRTELEKIDQTENAQNREPIPASSNPQNLLEVELLQIWREVLHRNELGVEDDFFESGGHSLLALTLFAKIENRLGTKLPLATLFESPTVRRLARAIEIGGWKRSHVCLVPIQPRGKRRTLFCIHAHGGHVFFYRDLAKLLGDDQPLYGLQAPSLDGQHPPLRSVEEMARRYVEEIRRLQPKGPYHIAGYCAGGIIAIEMAQQLLRLGEETPMLALIETSAPGFSHFKKGTPQWMKWLQGRIQEFQLHLGSLQMLTAREKLAYIQRRWRHPIAALASRVKKLLGLRNPTPEADPLRETQAAILDAVKCYKISSYPGKIVLFKTSRSRFGSVESVSLGWENVQLGGLEVKQTPGYPGALVLEPRVRLIADQIRDQLNRQ